MKLSLGFLIISSCFIASYAVPQFGFGLANRFADRVSNLPGVNRIAPLAQFPKLSSVRDFGEFVVSTYKQFLILYIYIF